MAAKKQTKNSKKSDKPVKPEKLVAGSKIKRIFAESELRMSGEVSHALSDFIRKLIPLAVKATEDSKMSTVKGRHIEAALEAWKSKGTVQQEPSGD